MNDLSRPAGPSLVVGIGRPVVERLAERLRQAADLGDVVETAASPGSGGDHRPARSGLVPVLPGLQQDGDRADLAGVEVPLDGGQSVHALAGRRPARRWPGRRNAPGSRGPPAAAAATTDVTQMAAGRAVTCRLSQPHMAVSRLGGGLPGFGRPTGQKTAGPRMRSRAGARVSEAASATARLTAMAGPPERTLANSAKAIRPRPQITVPALAARAPPTEATLRARAVVPATCPPPVPRGSG